MSSGVEGERFGYSERKDAEARRNAPCSVSQEGSRARQGPADGRAMGPRTAALQSQSPFLAQLERIPRS